MNYDQDGLIKDRIDKTKETFEDIDPLIPLVEEFIRTIELEIHKIT